MLNVNYMYTYFLNWKALIKYPTMTHKILHYSYYYCYHSVYVEVYSKLLLFSGS